MFENQWIKFTLSVFAYIDSYWVLQKSACLSTHLSTAIRLRLKWLIAANMFAYYAKVLIMTQKYFYNTVPGVNLFKNGVNLFTFL
jgi:hypothetical protein